MSEDNIDVLFATDSIEANNFVSKVSSNISLVGLDTLFTTLNYAGSVSRNYSRAIELALNSTANYSIGVSGMSFSGIDFSQAFYTETTGLSTFDSAGCVSSQLVTKKSFLEIAILNAESNSSLIGVDYTSGDLLEIIIKGRLSLLIQQTILLAR